MTFEELKDKAHSLPMEPGVYLMQDQIGQVIYVGKAKRLRNRVSQYFADLASHTSKTRMMVSQIHQFDVIVAASEFEALVLECSLIKHHMPKYNILLKDDKGYPYVRIDMREEYPVMTMSKAAVQDGALYFGPFGGRYVTQQLIDTIRLTFSLPGCSRQFPRDIGKDRPCLNYHMRICDGWCQYGKSSVAYRSVLEQVCMVLQGKYKQVSELLKQQMEEAAEVLEFERAASIRDRFLAVENLGKKQLVTAGTMAHTDVIGYYQSESKGCFAVLHYVGGDLLDKEYEIIPAADDSSEALSTLVKQFYLSRNSAPKEILLPFEMEDAELFSQLLFDKLKKKVRIRVPQRGDGVRLSELACKNAREEADRVTTKEERASGTLLLMQEALGLNEVPHRIESYDISHLAGTDIVASMVVFQDGKPLKKEYKRFKLENMDNQDDYASMRQVLLRRFLHYTKQDRGFDAKPDLLLIDGGSAHAGVAEETLIELGLSFPVFGMVKDHRHRTRALITSDGREIGIAQIQPLFSLVGKIQEETHRFAITYQRQLRSKHIQESVLDQIEGIGPVRKKQLLKRFRTVASIKKADIAQLREILPESAAMAVYSYFRKEDTICE